MFDKIEAFNASPYIFPVIFHDIKVQEIEPLSHRVRMDGRRRIAES